MAYIEWHQFRNAIAEKWNMETDKLSDSAIYIDISGCAVFDLRRLHSFTSSCPHTLSI